FFAAAWAAAAVPALPAAEPLPASPTSTVKQPMAGMEGGPVQTDISETRAAGFLPKSTPMLPRETGPPTWGTGPVHMGQTCMSPKVEDGILPTMRVGLPRMMEPPWAVVSPMRAAGLPTGILLHAVFQEGEF